MQEIFLGSSRNGPGGGFSYPGAAAAKPGALVIIVMADFVSVTLILMKYNSRVKRRSQLIKVGVARHLSWDVRILLSPQRAWEIPY